MTGQKVQDSSFEFLRHEFGDRGMMELTALIAFQNLSSKFNAALDVPAQGFCKVPTSIP
jgi:alkylhydroperoxidase family enzyme